MIYRRNLAVNPKTHYFALHSNLLCYIFVITNELNYKQMKLTNTTAQMRKGILELCVLNIVSHGEVYPSDIMKELKDVKLIIVEGTLYPLLSRLKNADLLSYTWKESQSGPPRKYFTITEAGTAFLEELKTNWDSLNNAVNKILKSK